MQRDDQDRYLPPTRPPTPSETDNSDELLDTSTDLSTQSSQFGLSPAVWTPQEIGLVTPPVPLTPSPRNPTSICDEEEMTDTANVFFRGKPEDQDPHDFMNRIKCTILMKSGLTEADKVRFVELSIKTKSPVEAWLVTLTAANKESFKMLRAVFMLQWPAKPITEKTMAEKQALLDETTLKPGDLGKRVAASLGAEKELSHT